MLITKWNSAIPHIISHNVTRKQPAGAPPRSVKPGELSKTYQSLPVPRARFETLKNMKLNQVNGSRGGSAFQEEVSSRLTLSKMVPIVCCIVHPTSAVTKNSDWRRPGSGWNLELVLQQTARTENLRSRA